MLQWRPVDISVPTLALLSALASGCANGGQETARGFVRDAGALTSNDAEGFRVDVDASDDGSSSDAASDEQSETPQFGGDGSASTSCQATCGGCCSGATCASFSEQSDTECGIYGAACRDCTQVGQTCNVGSCQSGSTGTGTGGGTGGANCATTCAGCCDSTGTCQDGTSQSACGDGTPGDSCQNCWPLACDPSFGGCFIF
jgi:hypothetical protein